MVNNTAQPKGDSTMDFIAKNEFVEKVNYGSNFAYTLNDNNTFLSTEYKVLQSQTEDRFVRCMKLIYNGKIQLYYLTNGMKTLSEIIPAIDAEKFMIIASNLFASIVSVKNNGFLFCQNLDISFDRIIIDQSTYSVRLVYIPISQKLYKDMFSFENTLRTSLINFIQNNPSISTARTSDFFTALSNSALTLEDIYESIKFNSVNQTEGKNNRIAPISPKSIKMKLIAQNTPVPLEIEIAKAEFVLGRKQELVDGVIAFSKMIGRTHCKVIQNKNCFAIIDLQSTNGTYVNGVRLQPNNPCPIKNGDLIRLANCELKAVIC